MKTQSQLALSLGLALFTIRDFLWRRAVAKSIATARRMQLPSVARTKG